MGLEDINRPSLFDLENSLDAIEIGFAPAVRRNAHDRYQAPLHELDVTTENLSIVGAAFGQVFPDLAYAKAYFYQMTGHPVGVAVDDLRGERSFTVRFIHSWYSSEELI